MKYRGKKPHNVWASYIDTYTPKDGVFLVPFCGSGMSALESLRLKRKTLAFDINPLSSFLLKIYTTHFDFNAFKKEALKIIDNVRKDSIYQKLWAYDGEFHNFKYYDGEIYEICKVDKNIYYEATQKDLKSLKFADSINLQDLGLNFIDEPFLDSDSFSANFIKQIGGNNFKYMDKMQFNYSIFNL